MSSAIAWYPGSITSAWAYRKNFQAIPAVSVKTLCLVTLTGAFAGALLLLLTPKSSFDQIIPWLLLLGSVVFAFGARIGALLAKHHRPNRTLLLVVQFFLGIYGGYFGGAVGIMMMAAWS